MKEVNQKTGKMVHEFRKECVNFKSPKQTRTHTFEQQVMEGRHFTCARDNTFMSRTIKKINKNW